MTLPLAQGFPDWGRFVSEAQVLEVSDVGVVHSGVFVYPIRYVGNGKAIQVRFQPTTIPCRVSFRFYGDSAGTFLSDFYNIDCQTNDRGKQAVPVLGPYMDVAVSPSAGGNYTYTLLAWRVGSDGQYAGGDGDANVFGNIGNAIGAGATITLDSGFVMEGQAFVTGFSPATGWQMNIDAVDFQGNVFFLDSFVGVANSSFNHGLFLPPYHIRATIQNTGAASNYSLMMTRKHNR